MKMSAGDFFDRWTILRMKARLDKDATAELTLFENEIPSHMPAMEYIRDFMDSIAQLAESNAKIWLCEASIRQEYRDDPATGEEPSLEDIGRKTLEIRGYNRLRIEAKNRINTIFGSIPDNKVQHASQ